MEALEAGCGGCVWRLRVLIDSVVCFVGTDSDTPLQVSGPRHQRRRAHGEGRVRAVHVGARA